MSRLCASLLLRGGRGARAAKRMTTSPKWLAKNNALPVVSSAFRCLSTAPANEEDPAPSSSSSSVPAPSSFSAPNRFHRMRFDLLIDQVGNRSVQSNRVFAEEAEALVERVAVTRKVSSSNAVAILR